MYHLPVPHKPGVHKRHRHHHPRKRFILRKRRFF